MHRITAFIFFSALLYSQPHQPLAAGLANLPLTFEKSSGQINGQTFFHARTGAGEVDLTAQGMAFGFFGRRPAAVNLVLEGRNPGSVPAGEDEEPGRINYLLGNDPARWRTGIPTYSKVRYREIYKGIDLIYYGNRRRLEYDFLVATGADPGAIRMHFKENARLRLTREGDLLCATPAGSIELQKPVAYQESNGARKMVAVAFQIAGDGRVSFRVGAYDRGKPLVIDPVLVFSTFLGGSGSDAAYAIATDAAGNIYVAGSTSSADFPTTPNALQGSQSAASGFTSAFLTKLNPSGTALIYSTYIGGKNRDSAVPNDVAYALTVDSSGAAYIAGQTASKDFPVTSGALLTTYPDSHTSFVAKLNPAGSALTYATYLGGPSSISYLCCDAANAIAIDSAGNAYVAGTTYTSHFPVTPGAFQTKLGNGLASNAYVAKLNPSGSALVYATYLGGQGQGVFNIGPAVFAGDGSAALAVDGAGNAYVTGYAFSADFPITSGAFQTKNKAVTMGLNSPFPGANAFVSKLNPSGSALVFSTFLGGSGVSIPNGPGATAIIFGDSAAALAIDASSNVYVAGSATSADFPVTQGAYQTKQQAAQPPPPANIFANGSNAFVTKLNATGTSLIYSTFLGGSVTDSARALAIDGSGNAFIAGSTKSLDFPVVKGAFQPVNKNAFVNQVPAAFVAELNPSGSTLVYSTFLSGTGMGNGGAQPAGDAAVALALDSAANVFVAGTTFSPDFPTTQGAFQNVHNSAGNKASGANRLNAFVAKLNPSAPVTGDPPSIRPNLGVVDPANYQAAVAAGQLATIFGYNLAATTEGASTLPLPTTLGGTQVVVGGIAAPLAYVSPSQINFQIPWELTGQTQTTLAVKTAFGDSSTRLGAFALTLSQAAPAIFSATGSGIGQAIVIDSQGRIARPETPASLGQTVAIYCTGLGSVSNPPPTGAVASDGSSQTTRTTSVTIGGLSAQVTYSGLAPGFVGVYQINAIVPLGVSPGSAVPVSVSVGGVASKTMTIALQ